jgi:glucan phosphoethanolaminetransferase (alkaline phosphatase superfamily)
MRAHEGVCAREKDNTSKNTRDFIHILYTTCVSYRVFFVCWCFFASFHKSDAVFVFFCARAHYYIYMMLYTIYFDAGVIKFLCTHTNKQREWRRVRRTRKGPKNAQESIMFEQKSVLPA